MTRVVWSLMLLLVSEPSTTGQQRLAETGHAVVTGTASTGYLALGLRPSSCPDGTVLVAPVTPPRAQLGLLLRIAADGRRVDTIDLRTVPGLSKAGLISAGLTPDGDTLVLAGLPTRDVTGARVLVRLDAKGKVVSKVPLDATHWVTLVPFSSGRFLASGAADDDTPSLAVLDAAGKTQARVRPRTSEDSRPGQVEGERSLDDRGWGELTIAAPTTDDHVWVVRPDVRGPAYEIDSSGEIVKKLELQPPAGASGIAMAMVSGNRLAVEYSLDTPEEGRKLPVLSVFDVDAGTRVADYTAAGLGILVGYTNDGSGDRFTFIAPSAEGLVLRTAAPQ